MITIYFEAHASTTDNEAQVASGHNDVALSETGLKQAVELGKRYKNKRLDAIFCSDLQRSYNTAQLAFPAVKFPIITDKRLRECDYGDLTQHPKQEVDAQKPHRISTPFPNGESYKDTARRMKSFLEDLLADYDNGEVMVIGHRATQYGLEHWVNEVPLEEAVTAPWKWQPGWIYKLDAL